MKMLHVKRKQIYRETDFLKEMIWFEEKKWGGERDATVV